MRISAFLHIKPARPGWHRPGPVHVAEVRAAGHFLETDQARGQAPMRNYSIVIVFGTALTAVLAAGCDGMSTNVDDPTREAIRDSAEAPDAQAVVRAEAYVPELSAARKAGKIGRRDEWSQMIAVLELEGKELKQFKAAVEERNNKWDAYLNKDPFKKHKSLSAELKQARKAKDQDKVDKLQPQVEKLGQQVWDFREAIRADVLATLTPAQRKGWAGFVLWERTIGRFRKADLSDEQQQESLEVCTKLADKHLFAEGDITQTDPYLRSAYSLRSDATEAIKKQVLDDKQREAMN
jgi:hypothetical protein